MSIHQPITDGGAAGRGAEETPRPAAALRFGGVFSRADRFLARVDVHLPTLGTKLARKQFLENQVRFWERSYALFLETEGASENNESDPDPVMASDYMLTIAGLQQRYGRV